MWLQVFVAICLVNLCALQKDYYDTEEVQLTCIYELLYGEWVGMSSSDRADLELITWTCHDCFSSFTRRYGCNMQRLTVLTRDSRLEEVKGIHRPGKSDQDVVAFFAYNTGSRYLPKRLGVFFPNMKMLKITKSQLRLIEFRDFYNMKQLKELLLSENRIEKLPACLFRYAENVEIIDLSQNRIKVLPEDAFNNLPNLHTVLLNNNALMRVFQGAFTFNANLNRVEMRHNNLSIIEVNFMKTRAIDVIDFRNNFCINLDYISTRGTPLREFMNQTSTNCKGPEYCWANFTLCILRKQKKVSQRTAIKKKKLGTTKMSSLQKLFSYAITRLLCTPFRHGGSLDSWTAMLLFSAFLLAQKPLSMAEKKKMSSIIDPVYGNFMRCCHFGVFLLSLCSALFYLSLAACRAREGLWPIWQHDQSSVIYFLYFGVCCTAFNTCWSHPSQHSFNYGLSLTQPLNALRKIENQMENEEEKSKTCW